MAGINKLGFLNSLIEIVNNNMEEDAATSVLARYFLVNFNRLPELNIYDVAENCFVTRSSVRRFCQSLGFDNYKELKKQLEILGIKKDNIKIFDNLYDWTRLIDIYNHIEST